MRRALATALTIWAVLPAAMPRAAEELPGPLGGPTPRTWKEVIRRNADRGVRVWRPEIARADGVRIVRDVVFAERDEKTCRLDLYLPGEQNGSKPPVVVLIHGGGWKDGTRDRMHRACLWLSGRGFAAATIDYRLLGEAPYPAAADDCRAAVDWLIENAGDYDGYDPGRIAVWGTSAGAHLAALTAVTHDAVGAAVVIAGPVDLTTEFFQERSLDPESNVFRFLRGTYTELPAVYADASPALHVDADSPPVFFITEQPFERAGRYLTNLDEYGIPYETMTLAGGRHGHWNYEPWFTPLMERADAFLRASLAE
ncbi:MAG: alpha/beta hydrolase [Planctomycetota bacterium]